VAERILVVNFENVSVSAVVDFFSLKNSTTNGLELRGFSISAGGQTSPAELRVRLKRVTGGTVTQGSGGTVATANLVDTGIGAVGAKATAHTCDTTQGTGTTVTLLLPWQWNMLQDLLYVPTTVEERECIGPSEMIIVDLAAAPAAATNFSGWIKYSEYP